MPLLGSSLLVLLAVFNVFFLPGYGFVRRFVKSADPIEIAVLSLGVGLLGGSFVYFAVAALLHLWMTPPVILISANVLNVLFLPIFVPDARSWWRSRSAIPSPGARPRRQIRVFCVATGVAAVFLLMRYDANEFHLTCTNYPVAYVTGIPMGDGSDSNPDRNDILRLNMEEREGNVAVIAATPALFPFFGYRLFYALEGLVIFSFAFLLGERTLGTFRSGLVVAVLFLFYPFLASITELDQNMNVLAASLAMFYLLVRQGISPALAGFFFGIAFGCRHIVLPGILGPLAYIAASDRSGQKTIRFLGGFAVPALLWALHHQLAFGQVFYEETYRHFAQTFPHEFLGVHFELPAILQWPFVPELLRSPYNGLPQVLLFPVALVQQSGTILAAFGAVGAAWMFWARGKEFSLLLLWFAPIASILMIQGHSSEVTKLRLAIDVFGPLLLWMGAGLVWLSRAKRRTLASIAVVATVAAALTISVRALDHLRFPVDPREYAAHPDIPREGEGEYAIVRHEITQVALYPTPLFPLIIPLLEEGRLAQVGNEILHDRFEDHPESIPQSIARYFQPAEWRRTYEPHIRWKPPEQVSLPRKNPIVLRLDLRDRPSRNADFLAVAADAPAARIDLTALGGELYLQNRQVPFHDGATDFLIRRQIMGGSEVILVFMISRNHDFHEDPPTQFAGAELFFEINDGTQVMFAHFLHSMPLIALAWQAQFDRRADGNRPVQLEPRKI